MSIITFRGYRLVGPKRVFVEGQKVTIYNGKRKRFVKTVTMTTINLHDVERYGSWVDIAENLVCAYYNGVNRAVYKRTKLIQFPHDSNDII